MIIYKKGTFQETDDEVLIPIEKESGHNVGIHRSQHPDSYYQAAPRETALSPRPPSRGRLISIHSHINPLIAQESDQSPSVDTGLAPIDSIAACRPSPTVSTPSVQKPSTSSMEEKFSRLMRLSPSSQTNLGEIASEVQSLYDISGDGSDLRRWLRILLDLFELTWETVEGRTENISAQRLVVLMLCSIAPEGSGRIGDLINALGARIQRFVEERLAPYGWTVIRPVIGTEFDPREHTCGGSEEISEPRLDGKIVSVVYPGLRSGRRIDVAAKVILGKLADSISP